jgi:hypothetical protein
MNDNGAPLQSPLYLHLIFNYDPGNFGDAVDAVRSFLMWQVVALQSLGWSYLGCNSSSSQESWI